MRAVFIPSATLTTAFLALPLLLVSTAQAQTVTPDLQTAAVGRDPFNRVQAKDTAGFVWLLQRNAALRQRYARHFKIPEGEVVSFVRNALVLSTMQEDTNMTTFGITKSGMIYPVKTRLKKGTKVWATREGVPVLKWNCSNPLEWELPGQELREKPYRITVTPNSTVPPDEALALAVPDQLTVPITPDPIPLDALVAVVPAEPVFSPAVPITPEVPTNFPAGSTGGGGNFGIFLPLLVGAGLAFSGGGSGGDMGNVIAVPESSTVALVSLGILASGAGIALKRRRK